MIEAVVTGAGTTLALFLLLKHTRPAVRFILAVGMAPMAVAMTLYLLLLVCPGLPATVYRLLLPALALVAAGLAWYREKPQWKCPDPWILVPLVLALPVFLCVTSSVTAFDPTNYQLIGRTFFEALSVREYPFVEAGRSVALFNWFSHPPMLPLMYTGLHLFGLSSGVPYVAPFYLVLIFLLVFQGVRDRAGTLQAGLALLLVASTPLLVRSGVEGFSTVIRVFFVLATLIVLTDDRENHSGAAGVLAGMTLLSHTIGLLILPMAGIANIWMTRRLDFRWLFRFGLIAVCVGGLPYGVVLLKHHHLAMSTVVADTFGTDLVAAVFKYQFVERGMASGPARILFGYLAPFCRLSAFGLTVSLAVAVLITGFFRKKDREHGLFFGALGFVLVYLAIHFLPVNRNIFILSPRYVLTVVPVIVVSAFALPIRRKAVIAGLTVVTAGVVVFNLWWSNPYFRKAFHYGEMRQVVNEHLSPADRVLVSQTPYFFYYHPEIPAIDTMDTRLKDVYGITDHATLLVQLKAMGITHLLMSYSPTPYDRQTFIRDLLTEPGRLSVIRHTDSHHLYRLNYPDPSFTPRLPETLFSWDLSTEYLPVVAYDKSGENRPVRVWFDAEGLRMFTGHVDTKVALARDIPWKPGTGYMETGDHPAIGIRVKFNRTREPFRLHWDLSQFDGSGQFLGTIHPRPVTVRDGWVTLQFPSSHPRLLDKHIPLKPECRSVALTFSFYRDHGGTSLEAIEIIGY